jgi:hypothetical protein
LKHTCGKRIAISIKTKLNVLERHMKKHAAEEIAVKLGVGELTLKNCRGAGKENGRRH